MSAPVWICPDCAESFDIPVVITRSDGRTVVRFGDDAIRAHIDSHEDHGWLRRIIAREDTIEEKA